MAYRFSSDAPICSSINAFSSGVEAMENGRLSRSSITTIRYCPARNEKSASGTKRTRYTVSVMASTEVTLQLKVVMRSLCRVFSSSHFTLRMRCPRRGGLKGYHYHLSSEKMASSSQISSIRAVTAGSFLIGRPHSRWVSPGHLLVASRPIFDPRPETGEAKSR